MKTYLKSAFLVGAVLLLFPNCLSGGWGDGDFTVTTTGSYTIALTVESVSATSVTLGITPSFNCDDVPIYRNGLTCGHVNLYANSTTRFVDSNVVSGADYTYRTGGLFFLIGEVWSNSVTVHIP